MGYENAEGLIIMHSPEVSVRDWKVMSYSEWLSYAKWYIKKTSSNIKEIGLYYNYKTDSSVYTFNGCVEEYYSSHNRKGEGIVLGAEKSFISETPPYTREITLKQFRVFTGSEVLGYKSPTDMCGGLVKSGDIFIKINDQFYGFESTEKVIAIPKEIVETWEVASRKLEEVIELGEPKRLFKVSLEDITVVDGAGLDRIYPISSLHNLYERFESFKFLKVACNMETIRIGCTDGVVLSKEDVFKLIHLNQKLRGQ